MSENAHQLRERLRSARQTANRTETSSTEQDRPTTDSTGRTSTEYVGISDQQSEPIRPTEGTAISNGSSEVRQSERTVRGSSGRSGIINRTASIIKGRDVSGTRSATQDNRRERSQPGRSGQNNSEGRSNGSNLSTSIDSGQRTIGRLERTPGDDQFIPVRNFTNADDSIGTEESQTGVTSPTIVKRGRGRPRKTPISGITDSFKKFATSGQVAEIDNDGNLSVKDSPIKKANEFFSTASNKAKGNRLSEQEVKSLKEPLASALESEFELLDRMLWGYGGDTSEQPIWSDITEKEMNAFVDSFLGLGKKSGTAAFVARTAVNLDDYIIVGGMLLPRMKKTVEIVRSRRGKKK